MSERSRRVFEGLIDRRRNGTAYSVRSDDRSTAAPLAIGARFRMSTLGAARNPRLADKEGTIVGGSRLNSSVRVLFDGRKSPMSLHRDYIKLIPSQTD
jgi:hypothetical protein